MRADTFPHRFLGNYFFTPPLIWVTSVTIATKKSLQKAHFFGPPLDLSNLPILARLLGA